MWYPKKSFSESSAHKQQISSFWFPVILAIYIGVFYGSYAIFNSLPTPNLSDDVSTPEFNARIARGYLTNLTSFGPKVAGSRVNEKDAVEYLLEQVEKIRDVMHPLHDLDVDVQVADGSVFLSSYRGVQNVVVRLRKRGSYNPYYALLINSHFDTVPVSPGGGDASTLIAVMLETLRVLATQPESFTHAIIFLFNGCEEISLQGSHAFVTQHPWAPSVKALINLDSAGNGGREILFQASEGHSWLMKYYRNHAPHPFSSAMGEELFQANAIPSDTDFRIFRDYGGIPGLDMAYSTNGYVYHTRHDIPEIVPDGTLQHTGDNVLALTRALADADELFDTDAHVEEAAVFFDFMNWFMVYYTKYQAIIVNSVIIVFCLGLQILSYFLNFLGRGEGESNWNWTVGVYFLIQLVSIAIACGAAIGLSFFYNAINTGMSWYHNSFLIFPLFMCPMFFFMALGPAVMRRFSKNITPWDSVEHGLNLHSWLMVIALIVMTILGVRTGFMVLVPLFLFVVSLIIQIVLKCFRIGARIKLIVFYLVQLVPFAFFSTWTVVAFATFIPFAARSGINSDYELIISAFAIGFGVLLAGFLIPTIPMYKSPIGVSLTFAALWLVGLFMALAPMGFPYAMDTAPQRMTANHVHREFFDYSGELRKEDSMFFVRGHDPNHHFVGRYLDLSESLSSQAECQREWLCGLPLISIAGFRNSYIFEAPKPTIPSVESNLRILGKTQTSGNQWTYTFLLTCPNNCAIYLSPTNGVSFGRWSLFPDNNFSQTLYSSNYINLHLENRPDLEFTLELTLPSTEMGTVLRAGVQSQYTAHRDNYAQEYKVLLSQFPRWTTTNDWITTFKSYEF